MSEFQRKIDGLAASFLPSPNQSLPGSEISPGGPANETPFSPVGSMAGSLALAHEQAQRAHALALRGMDQDARERQIQASQQALAMARLNAAWSSSIKWILLGVVIGFAVQPFFRSAFSRRR